MRHVSMGIYVSEAVADAIRREAEERGESFSKVVMDIVAEGLEDVDPAEFRNAGRPTSISISPDVYDELRRFAKAHGFQVGHVVRKLLEKWYWEQKVGARG